MRIFPNKSIFGYHNMVHSARRAAIHSADRKIALEESLETSPIESVLEDVKTVAVVGISDKLGRPSLTVSSYLKDHGFDVLPVNPNLSTVAHVPCYPDLKSLPVTPDLVVIFRKASDIPEVIREAVATAVPKVWIQEGIVSEEGYRLAEIAGMAIVMDKCILKEHARLVREGKISERHE
jgi:predicted CoA-binding protein